MNTMLVQNSVPTAVRVNFHNRDFSIPNTENSKSFELHFRNENTGRENRQLSQFPPFQRIPLREFNYHYEHKDTNSKLFFGFRQYGRVEVSVNNYILLDRMLSEVEVLLKNEYSWDEIDYRKPTTKDISRAKTFLMSFVFTIGSAGYIVKKPHISNSEDGGAKFEWHLGERSLYLRIDRLKSVVTKIWDESDRTIVDTKPLLQQNYLSLWKWIIND